VCNSEDCRGLQSIYPTFAHNPDTFDAQKSGQFDRDPGSHTPGGVSRLIRKPRPTAGLGMDSGPTGQGHDYKQPETVLDDQLSSVDGKTNRTGIMLWTQVRRIEFWFLVGQSGAQDPNMCRVMILHHPEELLLLAPTLLSDVHCAFRTIVKIWGETWSPRMSPEIWWTPTMLPVPNQAVPKERYLVPGEVESHHRIQQPSQRATVSRRTSLPTLSLGTARRCYPFRRRLGPRVGVRFIHRRRR
jgi:hypothetical protein